MPATSVRPNLLSLRSMSWMISAMARSAESFNAPRSSSTSNVHLSPSWVNSASNMSKRNSPSLGRYPLPDTNLNCASGSMKRRISQALAMRSTYTPCRVTQVLLRSVPNVLAPESTVALSVTASPSFNRASRFLIKPSAVSRPMAPKKSTETTSARRLRRRATCMRNSASASDFAFGRSDFANARASEQRAHLLVGKAVDQAGFAEKRFSASLLDLAQQPLEVFLRLLVHRQRVHGVLDRDGAEVLQPAPDLDAQIGRLCRQLMDEQKPAVRQRSGCSDIHEINIVSRQK